MVGYIMSYAEKIYCTSSAQSLCGIALDMLCGMIYNYYTAIFLRIPNKGGKLFWCGEKGEVK